MPLKKQPSNANEIGTYDEALIYQRGEYWQMRMWLAKEKKYARFSLRTRNRDTAEAKAKKYYHELMAQQLAGKTYFSMTAKRSGSVDLNSLPLIDKCDWGGFVKVQSCPAAAVVVNV
jgi:hypothetical protein